jgi:4-hydroxy-tetrahydrodipicolinate synthase
MSVIDNTGDIVRCVQNGGAGYISDTAIARPRVDFEFWDAIQAKRWSEAQAVLDRFHNPLGEFVTRTKHRSGGYRVGKAMMALLGQPVGPPRPPTLPLQDDEIAELRTLLISFGWLNAEGKAV